MGILGTAAANTSAHAREAMGAIGNAFKPSTWKAADAAAKAAAAKSPGIFSRMGSGIGSVLKYPFNASARAGLNVVEFPVAVALKPVDAVFKGITKVFTKYPLPALFVSGVGAVVGAGSWVAKRNSAKMQEQHQVLGEYLQAQAAASAAAPTSYMNSASYAPVQARIDADIANGTGPGSQAAAHATRQAAPAPEAAPTPAL